MQGLQKEKWLQLCEMAAVEQDPKKLLGLVKEINRLLDEKHQRLERGRSGGGSGEGGPGSKPIECARRRPRLRPIGIYPYPQPA